MGVDCQEIIVEPADSLCQLKEALDKCNANYRVIKLPLGMVHELFFLQDNGYKFIELITTCFNSGQIPKFSPVQERVLFSVGYESMDPSDLIELNQHIKDGMLKDDRVSLDPYFTQEQASGRYLGWLRDERERGAIFFKLTFKNEIIGFFTLLDLKNGNFVANLGGIYPKFQRNGFGFCMNNYEIQEGLKRGGKKIYTSFSSNNRGAAAIHFMLGCSLEKQYYVLIGHKAELHL
jgi:hypothetical protein